MIEYIRINRYGYYEASDPFVRLERAIERIPFSGCWLYLGRTCRGYANFYLRGRYHKAHRASWLMFRGPIPKGLHVLHRCDVRCCVNPAHLWLGDDADNAADRDAKGRHKALLGEEHGMHKLTVDDVIRIRTSGLPARLLAKELGVCESNIYYIRAGKSWRHVCPSQLVQAARDVARIFGK